MFELEKLNIFFHHFMLLCYFTEREERKILLYQECSIDLRSDRKYVGPDYSLSKIVVFHFLK